MRWAMPKRYYFESTPRGVDPTAEKKARPPATASPSATSMAGWGHTGELPGYNTAVYYHAASDITVAVQTNSDIASGDCAESPTLANDPRDSVSSSPATRIFAAITEALGHKFTPIPAR
jgi:hypothetical protein